jgi:sortase A
MKKHVIISIVFLLGAAAILSAALYPFLADYVNSHNQTRAVTHYIDKVAAMDDGSRQKLLADAHKYNAALLRKPDRFKFTPEETTAYEKQLDAGLGVMGVLAIDKINISLPIYHGTEEVVLQVGLGHMQSTSLPVGGTGTHAFITGHRGLPSSTLLSDLNKLEEDDTFVLYVMGETLTYRVDKIDVVDPYQVGALNIEPDTDYCTIVTCTPYGVNTHRLLVRGCRTENALNAGWGAIHADLRPLDKPLALLICLIPALPVLILLVILRCRKIRKGGIHYK